VVHLGVVMGKDKGSGFFERIAQTLVFALTRVATIYIAIFLIFFFLIDFKEPLKMAQFRVLNRVQPESYMYLINLMNKQASFDADKMREHLLYFRKIAEYLPDRAAAPAMLGFCYYHAGDNVRALANYQKSIKLNPVFFWSQYNLGLLYFKEGRYEEAASSFLDAVQTKPDVSLVIYYTSKIYSDMINGLQIPRSGVAQRLRGGYANAYRLLVLSYFSRGEYQKMLQQAVSAIQYDRFGFFYYYAGFGAYQNKDYEQAVLFLKECLNRDPAHKQAFYYMAMALKEMGQPQMSAGILRRHDSLPDRKDMVAIMKENLTLQIF